MNGGEISKNTASASTSARSASRSTISVYGGGVCVDNSTFTKAGGTIYGYTSSDTNSNTVKEANVVQSNHGHAVYVSSDKRRESTAGLTVNLDSKVEGAAGGWN